MTRRFACVALAVALGGSLTAQTIRIGAVAVSSATDADVLVLHEYDKATGKPYGTMPIRYVTEIHQRAASFLDIAIVEPRFGGPSLYSTRQAALAAAKPSVLGRPNEMSLTAGEASFNALSVLGVQPELGRDSTQSDVERGRRLVLLTDGGWRRAFGGRADVIGQIVWAARSQEPPQACEIIGVLPAYVSTATPEIDPKLDALVLAQMLFDTPLPDERAFAPIVRLKPAVTLGAAQQAIDEAVAGAQRALGAERYAGQGARLDTLRRVGGR